MVLTAEHQVREWFLVKAKLSHGAGCFDNLFHSIWMLQILLLQMLTCTILTRLTSDFRVKCSRASRVCLLTLPCTLVVLYSESCVLITIVRSPSNQKLVVSAAINQVLQNSLDRLMRVSITHPNYSYPYRDRGPLAAISIELVVAATRSATTHPSPCRSLLYTPSYAPGDFHSCEAINIGP